MTDTLSDVIKTTSITSAPILISQLEWLPWFIKLLTLIVGFGYICLKMSNEYLTRKKLKQDDTKSR